MMASRNTNGTNCWRNGVEAAVYPYAAKGIETQPQTAKRFGRLHLDPRLPGLLS
jgi:hypothetical protein